MKQPHQALIELNDDLVNAYYETATFDRWQDHRLLSVDGLVTQLPISNDLLKHFGKHVHMHLCLLLVPIVNLVEKIKTSPHQSTL